MVSSYIWCTERECYWKSKRRHEATRPIQFLWLVASPSFFREVTDFCLITIMRECLAWIWRGEETQVRLKDGRKGVGY